jgi:cytochrome b6-f complex iron-sulfur subunit
MFLLRYSRWTLTATAAALFYPLLRFSGFTVKPQPRHITVNKTLSIGGVHTGQEFILFMLEDGPVAVSRRCTHLGCRVHFRQEIGLIECPCHQSRFTVNGNRLAGPAQEDLPTFPVRKLEDDTGAVTGYIVTI